MTKAMEDFYGRWAVLTSIASLTNEWSRPTDGEDAPVKN